MDGLEVVCEAMLCACGSALSQGGADALHCGGCGRAYPVEDGIPVLVAEGAHRAAAEASAAVADAPAGVPSGAPVV